MIASAETLADKLIEAESLRPRHFHHAVQWWASRDLRDRDGYINGASREELLRLADMALRTWPK